ncbi:MULTISPECIES: UvrD-helicase domain-containing protein [Sphingomonas]|uniref:DNA 3'-5' helicase n=1 Tax=Sphingomonas hankookensis TaxID=563996 RepID=A0ABR5YA47_9SPHN|nr:MULTISPECIES: UvrD-helicase domain-containing protein [Sphingomonas]KZE10888.1 DNA/RNA helicase [Sphingomonas hankookensis]PZQ86774.1 MAG: ATP-dependent helicase [Leifsonia xyli]RSV21227.1 ATP-dependent helicase [Sphingomonas sp. ABOLH]
MSTVQVAVEKAGKLIETVERPLREAKGGPAVMYRRHLWRLHEGRIEINGTPLDNEADGPRQPRVNRPEPEAPPDDTAVRNCIAGASASARMLVDAGPGTGKTEIAARRLAGLVRRELSPSQLLVLSFSRSAVRTLTQRIGRIGETDARVVEELRHLSIRTFDSWAFRMLRLLGEAPQTLITRPHDHNIAALTELMGGDRRDDVRRFIGDRRHIVVDEFQDLPGVRGDLVLALLALLAPRGQEGCGFTILGDPAQAIYGFASGAREDGTPFPTPKQYWDEVGRLYDGELTHGSLVRNHRAEASLAQTSSSLRTVLLGDRPEREKLRVMLAAISALPEPAKPLGRGLLEAATGGSRAILTQTNGEALRVLQALYGQETEATAVPVRLHAGRHTALPPAWIGALLRKARSTSVPRSQFGRIHTHLADAWGKEGCARLGLPVEEVAWLRLARASGAAEDANAIDMAQLRDRLTWPDAFPDDQPVAEGGVIVTTVHQSKGMEFDAVTLLEPKERQKRDDGVEDDPGERASVAYVGMTRAGRTLERAPAGQIYRVPVHWDFADGRRRLSCWRKRWINMEMGLRGDIDPLGFADPELLGGAEGVEALQALLLTEAATLPGRKVMLCKHRAGDHAEWHIHLQEGNKPGRLLGRTANQLSKDLLKVLHKKGYKLPPTILNLRISSVGTVSAGDTDRLGEPERTSGLWLGVGLFGTGDFQTWKDKD